MLLVCRVWGIERLSAWYSKITPVYVANTGEEFYRIRNVVRRSNHNVDVENRFGGKSRNGSAANVFDRDCYIAQSTGDAAPYVLELD